MNHRHLETTITFVLISNFNATLGCLSHLQVRERVVIYWKRGLIISYRRIKFDFLSALLFLGFLDRGSSKETLNALVDLIGLWIKHHNVVSDVLVSGAESGELVWIFVFTDLRVGGKYLLERVNGLVHTALQELALIEQ